jgi:hypothetical protein
MNILEKRQDILKDNNTAQEQLEGILEKLDKSIVELDIREPLYGNVDFSILKENGFSRVKSILLVKGEVTDITGLPSHLEKLNCSDQYLIALNDLPGSLLELKCEYNYLKSIDLYKTRRLTLLNVSENRLTTIEGMPDTLRELYCDNNQLERLNLKDLFELRVLHCSNNKAIIVENVPPTLVDFKMDGNPFVKINYANLEMPGSPKESDQNKIVDYMEALNIYFKLKSGYENKYSQDKQTVYKNAIQRHMGKKKAILLASKVMPKCISCKRPVGSVFKSKTDDKNRLMYIATCGDVENPCTLHIELYKGNPENVDSFLEMLREFREYTKVEIITKKLDTIFKYVDEKIAIEEFNKNMEEYNEITADFLKHLEKHNNMYKDPIREQLIQKEMNDIYTMVSTIKEMMNEYKTNPVEHLFTSAVQIQKDMHFKIQKIRGLKYEILEMDTISIKKDVIKLDTDDSEEGSGQGYVGSKVFKRYSKLQSINDFGPNIPKVIKFSV